MLINNGCDHFPPQQEFGRIFERLSEAFSETTFRHTGLREFVDAVRASGVATGRYRGELLGGKLSHILSGVWSARMPLKQLNDRCQTLLAGQWEPLAAYAHFMLGRPYPGGLIDYAWKLLLKNHPHDSICGCSIDEVHQDMLPRFDGVIETGEESISETLRGLAPTFARAAPGDAQTVLCLANTLPFSRREVIERLVVLQPCCKPVEQLHLLDPDGREIPFGVLELHHVERFWGVDYRTMLSTDAQLAKFDDYCESFGERILKQSVETNLTDRYLLLQFSAELPPLGHANYRLTDASGTDAIPQTSEPVIVDGNRMHNGLISVTVHPDGTFDLLDQRGGRSFAGLNRLEDIEDIGDEYDHCPAAISETHTAEGIQGELGVVRSGGLAGAIEVSWVFPLPAEISPDRASRSEELVDCAVHTRITLRRGSPVVDIELAFDNQACDHRLQTCFPVGFSTDTVISDGHFYTNERPVVQPEGRDWCQPPAGTYPQQEFSLLQDADGGLALLNRGLPEIEAERDCLRLTLLRCVGWLSRDDFETRRRSNAGPTIPTPDAQCPGPQQFRYAVTPFQGDCHSAGIKQLSQAWHTPVVIVQGVEDQAVPGTSLLELTSTSSAVTAVKRHVARNTLVLRLYNLADDPVTETLILGREITAAWRINLLEERGAPLQPAGRHVTVTLTPHEIVSIEVAFD